MVDSLTINRSSIEYLFKISLRPSMYILKSWGDRILANTISHFKAIKNTSTPSYSHVLLFIPVTQTITKYNDTPLSIRFLNNVQ